MLLTSDKINWSHFSNRPRYIKDKDGNKIKKGWDRLFIGLSPIGRDWLSNKYQGSEPVLVFSLGVGNVVFVHREGESRIYVNIKAGAQAREYIKYYIEQVSIKQGVNVDSIDVVQVDDLPTSIITRESGGVKTLDDAIARAMSREIEVDF